MPSRKNNKRGKRRQPRKQTRTVTRTITRSSTPVGPPNMAMAAEYVNTLNDPFEYEGPRLGWGCLVPTTVATAYLRSTITSNADGSLALMALPNAKGLLYYDNSGAAVATWTSVDSTDQAAVSANFTSGRVISIGIKAFPSIAATAAPGASFAGMIVGQTAQNLVLFTPNDLEALPDTQMGIGTNGATAVGRPIDPTSFEYDQDIVNAAGYGANNTIIVPFGVPYICFEGLPASSPVVVEVVLNFEGLQKNAHAGAGLGIGAQGGEALSDTWGSFYQLWNKVRPALVQVASNTISSVGIAAANTLGQFAARQVNMPMERRLRIVR